MMRERGSVPEAREDMVRRLNQLAVDIQAALVRELEACARPTFSDKYVDTHVRLFERALAELNYVSGE